VQAVAATRPAPEQAVQAAQGAVPEADQVEPAAQAAGAGGVPPPPPVAAQAGAAQAQLPPEHVAVWPAGQLAGGVFVQAEQAVTYPPGEYEPAGHGMQ